MAKPQAGLLPSGPIASALREELLFHSVEAIRLHDTNGVHIDDDGAGGNPMLITEGN